MELTKAELHAALDEAIRDAEKKFGISIKFTLINIIGLLKMLYPEQPEKRATLIPLAKWNEYHDFPTVGALRQYKHYNTDNFIEVLEYSSGIKEKS